VLVDGYLRKLLAQPLDKPAHVRRGVRIGTVQAAGHPDHKRFDGLPLAVGHQVRKNALSRYRVQAGGNQLKRVRNGQADAFGSVIKGQNSCQSFVNSSGNKDTGSGHGFSYVRKGFRSLAGTNWVLNYFDFVEDHSSKNIRNSPATVRLPIILALTLAGGMLLGATFFGGRAPRSGDTLKYAAKYREILSWIENAYVDPVDSDSLVDYSIKQMLGHLDPHSTYIPKAEVAAARSQLEGGFDGIGVEFNQFNDTVYVINAIPGGPAASVGIRSGDRLLRADTTALVGAGVTNQLIFSRLRGPRGSQVRIEVQRPGERDPLTFTVNRGRIPSYSIPASYLVDAQTGYIKIDRFSETTFDEFRNAVAALKKQGMTRLMIDLRGNGGGYKDRATNLVDELVGGNKLILRTDGKAPQFDEDTYARRPGLFEQGPVVVLIDENSASASEIVAGALQDHDRALIVGRRSFGKGLVQTPIDLADGSQIRLTVSRYYTPSGRSIQKPYAVYDHEDEQRLKSGELFYADSIKFDTTKTFRTTGGRIVYGGGGIAPDVFVPVDTSYRTQYLYQLAGKNILAAYAFRYVLNNRPTISKLSFDEYNRNFRVTDAMLNDLTRLAAASGIPLRSADFARSKAYLQTQLKALIASYTWERRTGSGLRNELYQVLNANDPTFRRGLESFGQAESLATRK
jgi:carboxyl-terminal processing protease